MTTTHTTETQQIRPDIAALEPWALEVAHVLTTEKNRLRADAAFMAFAAAQPAPWTLDDCLAKALKQVDFPMPPRPSWAAEYDIDPIGFREIVFTFKATPVTAGSVGAYAVQSIWVDTIENRIVEFDTGISMTQDPDYALDGVLSAAESQQLLDVISEARAVLDAAE